MEIYSKDWKKLFWPFPASFSETLRKVSLLVDFPLGSILLRCHWGSLILGLVLNELLVFWFRCRLASSWQTQEKTWQNPKQCQNGHFGWYNIKWDIFLARKIYFVAEIICTSRNGILLCKYSESEKDKKSRRSKVLEVDKAIGDAFLKVFIVLF